MGVEGYRLLLKPEPARLFDNQFTVAEMVGITTGERRLSIAQISLAANFRLPAEYHPKAYEFYIVVGGSGTHRTANHNNLSYSPTEEPINKGNVVYIPRDLVHSLQGGPEGINLVALSFPAWQPEGNKEFDDSKITYNQQKSLQTHLFTRTGNNEITINQLDEMQNKWHLRHFTMIKSTLQPSQELLLIPMRQGLLRGDEGQTYQFSPGDVIVTIPGMPIHIASLDRSPVSFVSIRELH